MYSTANVQVPSQLSATSLNGTPALLSSVDIYEKFPFLSQTKYEKYRDFYYKNIDSHGRLSIQTVYRLFSYLNLPSKILDLVWSLCDVHSNGFLSLPEFLLFIYFLNLYLSCYELPHTLPSSLRRELHLADERLLVDLDKDHPGIDKAYRLLGKPHTVSQLTEQILIADKTGSEHKENSAVWLSPNKEPPDNLEERPTSTHPHIHTHPNLMELSQKIAKQRELLRSLESPSKEQQELEEIEQLKAKIKVIQNEITSVEESQPEMDFSKVIPWMISSSEQRYRLESDFDRMFSDVQSLTTEAKRLNSALAAAKMTLIHMNEGDAAKDQPTLNSRGGETFSQEMQNLSPVAHGAERARVEKEKRKSDQEIEMIERKANRMNSRLGRAEQFIHLYSEILMRSETSEDRLEDLDEFMKELKSSTLLPCITSRAKARPTSTAPSSVCECANAISIPSPVSVEERQMKMVQEAQKRLIEREKYLTEDFVRLKDEKEDAHNRIRRQEIEWKSIRHQALAQAQTTIANARAEMQAAREETAAKANRNNRARLAEETQVIMKLAREKIEAADRESHAIERLAKQKIDAACREREDLENKFQEKIRQVERAIEKTRLEKNEIKNICEGNHPICSSPTPPPVPPPPLPVSSSPSLVGISSLWLNRKPPSPTDFPRTSISSIQKATASCKSYSYVVSQPLVHTDDVRGESDDEENVSSHDPDVTLPFSVVALYPYETSGEQYLGFEKGAVIMVDPTVKADDWWFGKLETGEEGWFPKNYVYTEKVSSQAPFLARVLYDYKGTCNDQLFVKADSVVDILEKTDANWWKAQYQGSIGMIPARYVQQLMALPH
ncbi:hypothetical protein K493DRAFT_349026 [Basidiobolus meristosporus CBS 931.73]|uniref:Uncharacterized protein n=1 Tax=Basidiobolus meristosporus CBS 931.73 TaxID=1314790 RepID=A0A1Y1YLB4_9FUNG|nr:hypothetical protein K493DRAFT_349026 [Basidiobolus meristosporus CBS 931.73]|eukprot:ORX98800.1 hypothetical protein K493DRAFT_349026 [Basidiobolus meristosporus CBS 931.73]